MKPMVEIRNLKKYYGKGENLVKAVDHTNLTIERGKFTAIVGRSVPGKVPSFAFNGRSGQTG